MHILSFVSYYIAVPFVNSQSAKIEPFFAENRVFFAVGTRLCGDEKCGRPRQDASPVRTAAMRVNGAVLRRTARAKGAYSIVMISEKPVTSKISRMISFACSTFMLP